MGDVDLKFLWRLILDLGTDKENHDTNELFCCLAVAESFPHEDKATVIVT